MDGRDTCPYYHGTHAHRLLPKNKIQSFYTTTDRIIRKTPLHLEKGWLSLQAAERVGILSAAYKSPKNMYAAPTAGRNKSGGRTVKVQGFCG